MINVPKKTIVLLDSTKFVRRGFGKICGLDEIDHIITDSCVSEHIIVEGANITVAIV